jgi:sensor histidine kinase YesM
MRFGNKFDFEINLNEDVDTEMTKVPSMILQPFVENSIIHGVLPKEGKGFIKINIKKEYDALIFEVIDNGVGIDESSVLKSEFAGDHESKGMQITENRIELIRKINGSKLLIIGPFQLNDENGNSKGTKVIIKLPLNEID